MDRKSKIEGLLRSTTGNEMYNGWNNRTTFGYHSYNIEEVKIQGQRDPYIRISNLKNHIDFKDKGVVDFGCNVGAMLHHLPEIKFGIGFDYDGKCISAAKGISELLERNNLSFHVHDFDLKSINLVSDKIKEKPDVVFLLSLGSWIKKWRELYEFCLSLDSKIILETNNDRDGEVELAFFRDRGKRINLIVDNSLDDFTGNNRRKTYLID
jgi:SAM-dependent methyltransferase